LVPISSALVVSLLAVSLASCSSGGSDDSGNSDKAAGPFKILTETGSDRDAKLEAQAKKEGKLVVYTSNTATEAAAKEFGKLHPEIKVSTYLGKATDLVTRLGAEFDADKVGGDVLGMSNANMPEAQENGFFVEFNSPSVKEQPKSTIVPGKADGTILYAADREDYTVLGWNTDKIKDDEAPKTYDDLLDPKWDGKMAISGHTTGINWIGTVEDSQGDDYFAKLKAQHVRVQDVTAAALTDLVSSGEVPLSPNLGLSDIVKLTADGAPLAWRALEPAPAAGGSDGIISKAAHPAAALMFVDYLHSKKGQEFMVGQGVISPREDVATPGLGEVTFKSLDVSNEYSVDEYAKKYTEWQDLMQKTFVG
jgi:iron(III) transport system substrate-binding protein